MDDGALIILRRHGNPKGQRIVLSHGSGLSADLYYPFWSLLTDSFDIVIMMFAAMVGTRSAIFGYTTS